ncbi:MAG: YncE family protein [Gemmatimonadota bacterium]
MGVALTDFSSPAHVAEGGGFQAPPPSLRSGAGAGRGARRKARGTAAGGMRWAGLALAYLFGCTTLLAAQSDPEARGTRPAEYRVYVANESSDLVSRVVFAPGKGARVEKEIPVGIMPADNDGAHGITVSPDGDFWYVTVAHGTPYGSLWKFHAGPDTLVGRATLGLFPATMGVTPDGQFMFVANFNLHGDMVPSDVSVVYTPQMMEVARIPTCLMPHGSRLDRTGNRQYSACMHSDQLVEIDLGTFEVSRRLSVTPGSEGALALEDRGQHMGQDAAMDHAAHRQRAAMAAGEVCSPTWAEPGAGGRAGFVYVACNKHGEILEVDVESWSVRRHIPTGKAPYNLEATEDGRLLVATLKSEQAVALIDLESGREVARIPTSRPITHGVVASPDSRYAFVTNEAIGSVKGTLDVFDLERRERVASVDLGHQSGGIGFWRMTPVGVRP